MVVPHHYYIWDVLQRQSTLQAAEPWVIARERFQRIDAPRRSYLIGEIKHLDREVHYFGDHVAFDKEAWLAAGR